MLYTIAVFGILLDVVTGCTYAILNNMLNSSKLREGGKHKAGELLALLFGVYLKWALKELNIDVDIDITYLTCGYVIVMECVSIIENICFLKPNVVPEKIRKILEKIMF